MLRRSCSRDRSPASWFAAALVGALLASAQGCSEAKQAPAPAASSAPKSAEPAKAPEPAKPAANFAGTVTGIVKLAPGASLPRATLPQDVGTKVAVPPGCSQPTDADRETISQHPETKGLFPAHIAVTQMSAAPQREPRTHELFIDSETCRLTPRLIGAMVGDTLRLTNKSKAVFLPTLPGDAFMQALLAGNSREVKLSAMGPVNVQCGFAGFCGQTAVVTLGHTLYAVTDGEGRFKIEGVPLDQELLIHAWHPLFEVATSPVKLSAAETSKTIELLLAPQAAAATPPAAAPGKREAGASKSAAQPQ